MSDQRLRELEAAWRAGGSVEDEAAWLGARLQTGELEQGRVELAALLGGAAALALADHRLAQIEMLWEAWEAGLSSAPPELLARVFVALGRGFMGSPDGQDADADRLRRDFLSLEAAILGEAAAPRLGILWQGGESRSAAARNLYVAAHASFVRSLGPELPHLRGEDRVQRALDLATRHESSATLLRVVRSELCPWLLGYSDPVRERVERLRAEPRG